MNLSAVTATSVKVRRAGVQYDGAWLFRDFSMTLAAGQTTCLLGPSGVGKSTLLRLVAGLIPPNPEAEIADDSGRGLSGRIVWMGQQDLLLPWASVLDNVVLGARLRGERPDLERARRLLAEVGLEDRADDRPAALSGGMRQRAALARTLMEDRPIVLMDEPFSAVDAITRFNLQNLAARLLEGRTVLLVTHDPLEALRLGHVVHVLTGFPATIDAGLTPPGAPPRDSHDSAILTLQADLLERLAAGTEAA